MKKKFLAKYDEILAKHQNETIRSESLSNDEYGAHDAKIQALAALDTLSVFFRNLVSALPEDKKEELNSEFAKVYIGIIGEKKYDAWVKSNLNSPHAISEEAKKYQMLYLFPNTLIQEGYIRQFAEKAVEFIDDKTLENITDEIDSYKSDYVYNVKVYYFRDRIEKIKEKNKEKITDPEHLKALNDELDSIAETVVTSTSRYSMNNGDPIDAIARHNADRVVDELNQKALETDECKHLKEYFHAENEGMYVGARSIDESHYGDVDMINVFTDDKIKMVFPEDIKNSIRKIISYINEKNMMFDNVSAGEGARKQYGFKQIYEAHSRLEAVIDTDDLEAIRSAKEQYQTAVENMRGLYALIKEAFNPDLEMMIGNVISYRENWVPNEFKNDVVCNAFANGFFNLNVTLSQNGISVDEMLENPNKAFFNVIRKSSATVMPNAVLKGKSIAESVKLMTEGIVGGKYTAMGISRNLEFLQALTCHTDEYEKNSVSTMIIQAYSMYIPMVMQDPNSLMTNKYLKIKGVETLANVLLVNPEDLNYDKLCATERMRLDGTEKIPAFNTLDYLASHRVDPETLISRIKSTIAELHTTDIKSNDGNTKNTVMRDAVKAAQMAAYQYLMVHHAPSADFMSKKQYNMLKEIMQSPERAFARSLDKEIIAELRKSPLDYKAMESKGKNALDAARIEARNAENEYKLRVEEINKKLYGEDGKLNALLPEEKEKLERELKAISAAELERLDKAYTDGKLPKDYYEQRRLDVQNGNYEKTVPFGVNEYQSFNEFKEKYADELSDKEITTEDVKMFYERMMENARFEENKFFLIASGSHPKPTLESFAEETLEDVKVRMEVTEVKERNDGPKSPEVKQKNEPVQIKQI